MPNEPPKPQWTLDEAPTTMAIWGNTLVLRSGVAGVRFRGPASIVHEPCDFDGTYLAQRQVVAASLPASLRERRSASITLFSDPDIYNHHDEGADLEGGETSTVKSIAVYRLTEGVRGPAAKGDWFVGARLDMEEHGAFRWGTFTAMSELRMWAVRPASKELEAAALSEVRGLASYRARQEQYQSFAARFAHIEERANQARTRDSKARERLNWFQPKPLQPPGDLPNVSHIWQVSGPLAPSLLVAYFDWGEIEDVPDRDGVGSDQDKLVFDGTLLVIWSLDTELGPVLGEIAPAQTDPRGIDRFRLRGAVSSPISLPTLLFESAGVTTGVLQPIRGQYAIDAEHSLRIP